MKSVELKLNIYTSLFLLSVACFLLNTNVKCGHETKPKEFEFPEPQGRVSTKRPIVNETLPPYEEDPEYILPDPKPPEEEYPEKDGNDFKRNQEYYDQLLTDDSAHFKFFADKHMDLVARKFFASFENSHPFYPKGQYLSRLPPIRQLKLFYANISELLMDIKDLPLNNRLVSELTRSFQSRSYRNETLVKICSDIEICQTCPRVGALIKRMCDAKCAKLRQLTNENTDEAKCDSTRAACPSCQEPAWCPQIPPGHMCPPKPICPDNLCDILKKRTTKLLADSESLKMCLASSNATKTTISRCKWVLEGAEAASRKRHSFVSRRHPVRSNKFAAPSSQNNFSSLIFAGGVSFDHIIKTRAETNAAKLLQYVPRSESDWPVIIGKAFRRTIGGFVEILGVIADSWVPQKVIGPTGIQYTHEENYFYVEKLLATIEADLLRRKCRCPVCELFEPTIKCDCRKSEYRRQNDQKQRDSIDNVKWSESNKTAASCERVKICRPCSASNQCPVPLGCPVSSLCQDCQDLGLLEQAEDDSEQASQLYDVDPQQAVGRSDFEQAFVLPQNCKYCDDFKACGKAPHSKATFHKKATYENKSRSLNASHRIISGQEAARKNWPFFVQVKIRKSRGVSTCGGVLISRRHAITAGHCVSEGMELMKWINVTVGKHLTRNQDAFEKRIRVLSACRLSNYYDNYQGGVRYDMALLTLQEEVQFSEYAQPACLPRNLANFKQDKCFVIGMGKMGKHSDSSRDILARELAPNLQEMQVKRVSCNTWHISNSDRSRHCFTRVNGLGDTCDGDSGSPLLCQNEMGRWAVMGLVSYGSPECAGYPPYGWVAVYTRVPMLLKELEQDCKLLA